MTEAAAPVDITLTCPVPGCADEIVGMDKGKNSATWKLGRHKFAKHGIRGSGKPRKTGRSPTTEEVVDGTVAAQLRSVTSVMGTAGKPSADELAAGLGRALCLVSIGVASLAVETDPRVAPGPEGDATRDGLIDFLSVPDTTARQIMTPVGRALSGMTINERYGRQVVDNADLIGSAFDLGTIAMHWRRYWAGRRAGYDPEDYQTPPGGPASVPTGPPGGPGMQATSPAPQTGRVLSFDDIQARQGRQG